jgi:hypothetical protein
MYVQNQSYFFHWNQPKKKTEEMYYQNYTWNVQINKIGIKRFRTILKIHTFKLVTQH